MSSEPVVTEFGPNEWLVDELYQQYLSDKSSVDPAWWEFFADYQPAETPHLRTSSRPSDDSNSDPSDTIPATGTNGAASSRPVATAALQPPKPAPQPDSAQPAAAATPPSPAPASGTGTEAAGKQPSPTPKPAQQASRQAAKQAPATPPAARTPREPASSAPAKASSDGPQIARLKGPAARVVTNMEASLEVPTATSVRAVPAKLLIDNRIVINNHLVRSRGGKVSFTHLIGFALVEALELMPSMNASYAEDEGKPALVQPAHINLGIAIDMPKPDGTRQLLVPNVRHCDGMDFAEFWSAYEDVVRRARNNKLGADDFAGTTISLTNPGTIGTVHSVPRLMKGQGAIIGVGAMDYPAEYQGASEETIARLAVSKMMTLTSTYDHRIIQGAGSGEFLRIVHSKLLGEDGFYDRVFRSLRLPYEPVRWVRDISVSHDDQINKTARVQELIHSYRVRGHLMADTDPLEYKQRRHPDLDITTHGLTLWDLEREVPTGGFGGKPVAKLRHILGVLRDTYCRTVGIEYMHIQDPEQRRWLQARLERPYAKPSREEQLRILGRLNAAEAFETFLQTKFVGQKRFSLEGGESVIALLDEVLSNAARAELDEVCIGMPHRGRLNVLANIAGKSYGQIFREFEGQQDPRSVQGSGDVKYHLGTEGHYTTETGEKTKVYLAANPSHLEAVNPVLEGVARAKQDRLDRQGEIFSVLPVLLHGDAAFAGQGVVTETLNLSQLRGYRTGGTVHVVINNQVGFTTAPSSSRSSVYCTDAARMIQAPIFHVNGDDPEACVRVAKLAFEFRMAFDKDVVIDMVCYRRRGHNEGDDPSMTQPLMYNLIEAKRSVRKLYTEGLIGRGDITVEEAEQALRDYQQQLERVFAETRDTVNHPPTVNRDVTAGLDLPKAQQQDDAAGNGHTSAVSAEVLKRIGDAYVSPPSGFSVHPKLQTLLERRAAMASEGGVDWAFGEMLALGSILMDGTNVRFTGQDTRRGTFTQRHAVLTDKVTAEEWTPLLNLSDDQGKFWIYDSLLSEFAAMGFEYGYSVERPDALVLWEAQFGDFANGAQTIVDEFISSSEQKWGQRSSVTLLLPHGYEGQGPDHSSARIERYLQLCAENNMFVAQPSTPASYFHLLRRQAYAKPRKPLVVFTPKSMLRLKAAVSPIEEFTTGEFRPVISDSTELGSVDRVLLCSGKIYHDLAAERAKRNDTSTAIVRLEQLYPLDVEGVLAAIDPYRDAQLVWVQDEPANQGPWPSIALSLPQDLGGRPLLRISRPAAASPATGSAKKHQAEQAALIAQAFNR
ncbi:multifunctional oxoglutarate decarboxylase/oxoglutarate dehydrogenase thiamine pyrophosphate-binding subunit/dihydrolipoyllysine-residue succinyltransferase subunit [Kineosporia rhizophila]|uniref:multifunctional oxoglutarate decarboxylase/oxoglutarate dehydrogenase thiamine pyrophosphate-binding subunit/dihydrolipoyllysine-residue succinyltransferase subunit n=1 Tax=Kineosporia rhizophila TaxID=84633 RepID=UPI001E46ADF8|nr:multifunctional oxoglutarate decarboxylase/oxoglutarate dehydrogenase thiamine pyrophosphate-binding subunit/dihydrolipoyllysine-residue succinyltransferase subunit [Kineosporia rhizophila]